MLPEHPGRNHPTKTNMIDRLPIKTKRNCYGNTKENFICVPYGVVECPKEEKVVKVRVCKACEHCNICLEDVVKCSYRQDIQRIKKPFIHPVHLA